MWRDTMDPMIASYLLGELNDTDRNALEERYFADSEYYELVQSCEADLMDAYVSGELTADEREHFEALYAGKKTTPMDLSLAKAVRAEAQRRSSPGKKASWGWAAVFGWLRVTHGRAWGYAAAGLLAAVIVTAVGGLWIKTNREPAVLAYLVETSRDGRSGKTTRLLARLASFREKEGIRVTLPIALSEGAYELAVSRDEEEIWSTRVAVGAQQQEIQILLPQDKLTASDYVVRGWKDAPDAHRLPGNLSLGLKIHIDLQ